MMNTLHFTQEQIKKILLDLVQGENGIEVLLKLSLEAIMKAERTEHNLATGDMSNGYRMRKTYGRKKLLELRIPRSRSGQFYPMIMTLLKDQEEEVRQLAYRLYGSGLTTQQVGELFGELYGKSYSTSQVSRLFEHARSEVATWLERPLESYYPILLIDATFISTRRVDAVSKEAYYTILGVRADRTREVLAIVNFPTESAIAWSEVFDRLKQRGLERVDLVISDSLTAIEDSVKKHFPTADHQFCVVHLNRSVQKEVKPRHKQEVAQDFKDIFRTGDKRYSLQEALEAWAHFCHKWARYYPKIGRMAQNARISLYFTYLNYDYRIQSMIYSTNWIERLNRDYKRTTRMRGALPNPQATILLLGYVAINRSAYLRKVPKLDYEKKKFKWED